jgi:pentatricopeptide repeat protein
MSKDSWDRSVELSVLESFPDANYLLEIDEMIANSVQPDESTAIIVLESHFRVGNITGAFALYNMLKSADEVRIKIQKRKLNVLINNLNDEIHYLSQDNDGNSTTTTTNNKNSNDTGYGFINDYIALNGKLGLLMPPPTRQITHKLLEALREKGMYEEAIITLRDMIKRAKEAGYDFTKPLARDSDKSLTSESQWKDILAVETSAVDRQQLAIAARKAMQRQQMELNIDKKRQISKALESTTAANQTKFKVTPISHSLTASGRYLLSTQYMPDSDTFALVVEACLVANRPSVALKLFNEMEKVGITPNRRIYSALIQAFGMMNDISSALGVFEEMRRHISPDINSLQRILDVCLKDPVDIRQAAYVLENMALDGIDLDLYSKDILMMTFSDAATLSQALIMMESQTLFHKDLQVRLCIF